MAGSLRFMQIAPAAVKLFSTLVVSISLCAIAQANPSSSRNDDGRKTVAVTSGELHVPGLREPVRVLRDRWGVAHIYAGNQHDLFFAQGVVAAQDRLFQMELWKRAGQGRLSEILGPSALQRDIDARAPAVPGRHAQGIRELLSGYPGDTDGVYGRHQRLHRDARSARAAPACPIEFQLCGILARYLAPAGLPESHGGFSMTGNASRELYRGAGADGARRRQGRETL